MENWKITIIDRAENVLELRHRESYWQYRLDIFIPNGLNEHFVSILCYNFFLFLQQTFIAFVT